MRAVAGEKVPDKDCSRFALVSESRTEPAGRVTAPSEVGVRFAVSGSSECGTGRAVTKLGWA